MLSRFCLFLVSSLLLLEQAVHAYVDIETESFQRRLQSTRRIGHTLNKSYKGLAAVTVAAALSLFI